MNPKSSNDIQVIYAKTLEEMNQKQAAIYGIDPVEMEHAIILLINAHQKKLHATSRVKKEWLKMKLRKY